MAINYSAIVLTDESRNKLISQFGDRVPKDWEIIAHHCTIKMGELPPELKTSKGLPVQLDAIAWYQDDKVAALEILVPSEMKPFMANKDPHVTFAVNRAGGGKPVMSNKMIAAKKQEMELTQRVGLYFSPIKLMGQIQEVEK